jgi:predicted dehydrogenase
VRAKVIGAGSIGNHLAHALRTLEVDVTIVDVDADALERTKTVIYPERYGAFDPAITLAHPDTVGDAAFDLCVIGTPPDTHLKIATAELGHGHRAILIEKPLAAPGVQKLLDFAAKAQKSDTRVLVAYNQRIKTNTVEFLSRVRAEGRGSVTAISGRMREDWAGILKAHPWLKSATDSYLGHTSRGGGALYEHSHAVDFSLFIAHELGQGRPVRVKCESEKVSHAEGSYDKSATLAIEMSSGLVVDVVQDLSTWPADKSLDAVFEKGGVRWEMHGDHDSVISSIAGGASEEMTIPKTRPDDFLPEISHVVELLNSTEQWNSPLDLSEALYTSLVLEAALESSETGDWVTLEKFQVSSA